MVRRQLFVALALVAMLWNGMAGAMVRHFADAAADAKHAALHLKNVVHHHHKDGSYHTDDSAEAAAHVAVDHTHANSSVSTSALRIDLLDVSAPPPEFLASFLPSPHLPPWQRPPRPQD